MGDHVSLHQLELFCTVVDHGSYVQAAQTLIMTQPALSLQVKSLQTALGVTFFERHGNRLTLTESGHAAYDFAKDMLELERRLRSSMNEIRQQGLRSLSIGSSRPFGHYSLPYLISRYIHEMHDVDVSVVYRDTESIYSQVQNQILDIGVVTSDESMPVPDGLTSRLVRHDAWCLVCSQNSPWASDRVIDTRLFEEVPLITAPLHTLHWKLIQTVLSYCSIPEAICRVRLRMEDLESIKTVVLQGLGMAFLPYTAVRAELEKKQLLEFRFPGGKRPSLDSVVVTRNSQRLRPPVERFVDFLVRQLNEAATESP